MLFLVAAILAAAAIALFVTAVRDRRVWQDHQRQVALIRRWERSRRGRPFDQFAASRPAVTSPYARPADENPPPLPPRPGLTRMLWGVLLVCSALLVLAAGVASS